MSAKTEDVLRKRIERRLGHGFLQHFADDATKAWPQELIDDVRTLLASHAALVAEVGACRDLQNEHANLLEASRMQDERIASLEEQLGRVLPLLSGEDKMHPVGCSTWLLEAFVASEEIAALLSGKASA